MAAALLPALSGETVSFTVAATADLHGRSRQFQAYIAPEIAKLYSAVPDSTIYADIGDAVQGSLPLLLARGKGFLPQLSRAGCQLFVPGNHELDYGIAAFQELLEEFSGEILIGNLKTPGLSGKVKNFTIREFGGIKVAFIGSMPQYMQNLYSLERGALRLKPEPLSLRKNIDSARQAGAEVFILLRHAGIYGSGCTLRELLEAAPELDLVIGAHTHQSEAGLRHGDSWYVQPPAHGLGLAICKVTLDCKLRRVRQIESHIMEFPDGGEDEFALGKTLIPGSGSAEFAVELLRQKMPSDLALCTTEKNEALRQLTEKPQLTLNECYQLFPYFDRIVTVQVSIGELRRIADEVQQLANERDLALLTGGFRLKNDPQGRVDIQLPADKKIYTLSLPLYIASGAGGKLPAVRRILARKIDSSRLKTAPCILEIIAESIK